MSLDVRGKEGYLDQAAKGKHSRRPDFRVADNQQPGQQVGSALLNSHPRNLPTQTPASVMTTTTNAHLSQLTNPAFSSIVDQPNTGRDASRMLKHSSSHITF